MRFVLLLFLAAAGCGGGKGVFAFSSSPPRVVVAGKTLSYRLTVANADGAAVFELRDGPAGMTLTGSLLEWSPEYDDLGSYDVSVEARAGGVAVRQDWTLRVSQGVLMGTALSPRGHTLGSTAQDFVDFYSGHGPWGDLIAFHLSWRETGAGAIPSTAKAAMTAAEQYGFFPAIGFGWADGDGVPDLRSNSDPLNNSWSNLETRALFRTMVEQFALQYRPPVLFLGNETNAYWLNATPSQWANWLSELVACYAAIKRVSPGTVVFTVFQYERMKGLGAHSGWSDAAHLQLIDELQEGLHVDAVGFTSYPYLEYDAPSDVPADYYDAIAARWDGLVLFTEIGWLSAPSGPYPGSTADQAEFVDLFFDRSKALPLGYVSWLFLHDWDQQASIPAFAGIGLRDNAGTVVRPADVAWRAAVALRE